MRVGCFGIGIFIIMVTMIKLLLVVGIPYVKQEELFYAGELSVKKTFEELVDGKAQNPNSQILKNMGKILGVIHDVIVDNVDYDIQGKKMTVEIRYRYVLPTGQIRYAKIRRTVMQNE
ncbi:MAG: hypothetical protein K6E39_00750 [Lachnospiraceae bacterium]|nr:hypothetical protein [Lachnospiraceae bacterium]